MDAVTTAWLLLLAGGAGAAIGYLLGRRVRAGPSALRLSGGPTPPLPTSFPIPRSSGCAAPSGAFGVWAIETRGPGLGVRTYQSLDPGWGAGGPELDVIEQRLSASSARDGEGAERLDAGLLLTASAGGAVVAILLPSDASSSLQSHARADLGALLDGIGRRPVLHDLAQVQDGLAIESVESVGMRLAYQVERIAGAEAYVAAVEGTGCRVIGVSGLADRRALGQVLPAEAMLARVSRGAEPEAASGDPLGGSGTDRRRHPPARVTPLLRFDEAIGGVAWRVPDGGLGVAGHDP